MQGIHKAKLVLFSNTFPYGTGESFLADEITYLAKEFHRITVFPLYRPQGEKRALPGNVETATPLLPFDHKSKRGFLRSGIFNTAPFFFATKEFFRALFGTGIKLESLPGKKASVVHKKAGLLKRLRIFFSYFFMLRTILSQKKLMEEIVRECSFADKIYFYWGDKSAMLVPWLKKRLKPNVESMPMFCVRFHGSDLYEGAKGWLPFRRMIMESTDYAMPVSNDGMNYIRHNYNPCPKTVEVWHLGSFHHDENFANLKSEKAESQEHEKRTFSIVGCSYVNPLKRVDLTLRALTLLSKDMEAASKIKERGFDKITYTHFGGGKMLASLKEIAEDANSSQKEIETKFRLEGAKTHTQIMEYYRNRGADLFVLVSKSEGVPVSVMEAMSFGIPVIATNVGGVSELFALHKSEPSSTNGQSISKAQLIDRRQIGCLIDANISAEELKEKILEYILLPDSTHNQMKRNCYISWKENWDAETNYTAFAQELLSL